MDLNFSPEELAFRDEVRAFLAAHVPQEIRRKVTEHRRLEQSDIVRWQQTLADKGWLAGHWPNEFGGCGWTAAARNLPPLCRLVVPTWLAGIHRAARYLLSDGVQGYGDALT